eukprot:PhM_4_TR2091/c3_g1_i1/m.35935
MRRSSSRMPIVVGSTASGCRARPMRCCLRVSSVMRTRNDDGEPWRGIFSSRTERSHASLPLYALKSRWAPTGVDFIVSASKATRRRECRSNRICRHAWKWSTSRVPDASTHTTTLATGALPSYVERVNVCCWESGTTACCVDSAEGSKFGAPAPPETMKEAARSVPSAIDWHRTLCGTKLPTDARKFTEPKAMLLLLALPPMMDALFGAIERLFGVGGSIDSGSGDCCPVKERFVMLPTKFWFPLPGAARKLPERRWLFGCATLLGAAAGFLEADPRAEQSQQRLSGWRFFTTEMGSALQFPQMVRRQRRHQCLRRMNVNSVEQMEHRELDLSTPRLRPGAAEEVEFAWGGCFEGVAGAGGVFSCAGGAFCGVSDRVVADGVGCCCC